MNDDAKSASILPYGQFVLAALALPGVVTSLDPLRSSRPDGGISPYNAVPDAQDVPARLWQDPFDAVADQVGAAKSESRRRARYAVVAALDASGYTARDPGEIGYVWTDRAIGEHERHDGPRGRGGRIRHEPSRRGRPRRVGATRQCSRPMKRSSSPARSSYSDAAPLRRGEKSRGSTRCC